MKNKKKICLFMMIMALGVCNIVSEKVQAQDEVIQSPALVEADTPAKDEEIKGNKESFDKAVELMDKKDYQEAISYLTAYINSKPKKYEAYKLRGDAFYALRQYALAQDDYQMAIDLKADDDKFMTGTKYISAIVLGADKQEQLQNPELGNLYGRLMYAQKALNNPAYEATYEKAFQYNSHIYLPKPKKDDIAQINCPQKYGKILNPQGIDSYIYGAIDDIENENFRDAVFKSQYITSNYPDYYLGYYLTGVSFAGLEQEKDAIVSFNKALNLNPYDFESTASIAQVYFHEAEKTFSPSAAKKSNEYFKKALKYNPNCYIYYFYIGLNDLQMGNVESAISNFDRAVKLKPDDYNSLYYKLIAQYIKGDYNAVVTGATNLLYKHVSNYNSVLYLRAQAYNKIGSYDLSLEDLNKIQNDINDIYNADIKVVSEKEKTLDSYVYYLRAQLMKNQGFGAVADMQKAVKNPIIRKLSKVEDAVKSYENALNSPEISLGAYKKYEEFYKAELPKMLQSDMLITETDVDNQYDYLRTTFDTLGLSFVYKNPDYQFRTIDDYVYKKYASKLTPADLQTLVAQVPDDIRDEIATVKPLLREKAVDTDSLAQPSIARILASNSLGAGVITKTPSVSVQEVVNLPSETAVKTVQQPAAPDIENKNIALAQQTNLPETADVQTLETANVAQLETSAPQVKISEIPNGTAENVENSDSGEPKAILLEAPVQKPAETFRISYPEPVKPAQADPIAEVSPVIAKAEEITTEKADLKQAEEPVKTAKKDSIYVDKINADQFAKLENETVPEVSEIPEKTEEKADSQEKVEPVTQTLASSKPEIVEKHAQFVREDFPLEKPFPVIDENTEVIELEPDDFMHSMDRQLAAGAYEYSMKNEFPSAKHNQSVETAANVSSTVDSKIAEADSVQESEPIILPEPEVKKDEPVAVAAVVVPELDIIKQKEDAENSDVKIVTSETTLDEIKAQSAEQPKQEIELRPQATIAETANVETVPEVSKEISDNIVAEVAQNTAEFEKTPTIASVETAEIQTENEAVPQPEEKLSKAQAKAQAKLDKAREKEEHRQTELARKAAEQAEKQAKAEAEAQAKLAEKEAQVKAKEEELLARQAKAEADAQAKLAAKEEQAKLRKQREEAKAAAKIQAAEERAANKLTRKQQKEEQMKAEEEARLAKFNEMKARRLAYLEQEEKIKAEKAAQKAAKAQEKLAQKQAKEEAKAQARLAKQEAQAKAKEEELLAKQAEAQQRQTLMAEKAAQKAARAEAIKAKKAAMEKKKQDEAFARAEEILAEKRAKESRAQARLAEKEAQAKAKAEEQLIRQTQEEAKAQAKAQEKLLREKERQEQAEILAQDKLTKQAAEEARKSEEKLIKDKQRQEKAQAKAAEKLKQQEEKSLERNVKKSKDEKQKKKFRFWFGRKDKQAEALAPVIEAQNYQRKVIKELSK